MWIGGQDDGGLGRAVECDGDGDGDGNGNCNGSTS
jgi:hypothetical protein